MNPNKTNSSEELKKPLEVIENFSAGFARECLKQKGFQLTIEEFFSQLEKVELDNIALFLAADRAIVNQELYLNQYDDDFTPLKLALKKGELSLVKLLVYSGASIDAECMFYAAINPDVKLIQFLMNEGVDINVRYCGNTPLFFAAENGYLEVVQFLQKSGAQVNAANDYGETALHQAAYHGHLEVVQFLQKSGADINRATHCGETALHRAASNDHLEMIQLLIQLGANVNAPHYNYSNWTPLHYAAASRIDDHEYLKLVQFLINSGAKVDARTLRGSTPLHLACAQGNEKLISLLIDCGAKVDARTQNGSTPLHLASFSPKYDDCVIKLIELKADINSQNYQGLTALNTASKLRHYNLAQFLINLGADVNLPNKKGLTPLHWALKHLDMDMAKLLIQSGANIKAVDKNGKTPLDYVAQKQRLDIVRFLEKNAS